MPGRFGEVRVLAQPAHVGAAGTSELGFDPDEVREALPPSLDQVGPQVGCGGGIGRTGTALACIAVLDGVSAGEAVNLVRARYHPRAVETPAQRRLVARFRG